MSYAELAKISGVGFSTIRSWRYGTDPGLSNLEACLNVLGLTLEARHRF